MQSTLEFLNQTSNCLARETWVNLFMREGCNEAHGCLTSEVPFLATRGRRRYNYSPNLWSLSSPKPSPQSNTLHEKEKDFLELMLVQCTLKFLILYKSGYKSIFIVHGEMLQMHLYILAYRNILFMI